MPTPYQGEEFFTHYGMAVWQLKQYGKMILNLTIAFGKKRLARP
jgi:hypothetical protein